MKLVWKLLRQHISIPQFLGFFLASLIGMIIMLLGAQFYNDINAVYDSEDTFMNEDYIIINKRVGTLNSITGSGNAFSEEELKEIKEQEFVAKMGVFTPSSFKVRAGFNIQGVASFSTDMFFEAVPDEFVDVTSEKWSFKEGDSTIPIIIPKNYLDLYNFGFAQSQNMPEVSEGVLQAISIDITIMAGIDQQHYKGNIIGFSNRLNTILVPQAFMDMANNQLANKEPKAVSRVIIQVNDPTDEHITSFIQDNSYETDADKLKASKTNFLLKILVSIVVIIGFVISLLAFFILMLSIYLLVEKNITKLENLLLMGYSPAKVARPYQTLTIVLNLMVTALAVLTVFLIRRIYMGILENFFPNLSSPSMWPTWIMALAICLFASTVNYIIIKRKVLSIWTKK